MNATTATAEQHLTDDLRAAHDVLCALGVECPDWLNVEAAA